MTHPFRILVACETSGIARRQFLLHYARVTMREARARREQRAFSAWLMASAATARREAAALCKQPVQLDMFA